MTDTYNKKPAASSAKTRPKGNHITNENSAETVIEVVSSPEKGNSAKTLVHFSPSDAVRALGILNTIFFAEGACRTWSITFMHRERCCPWCDAAIEDKATIGNFLGGRKCTCKRCSRCFTARTKTFLEGSQLSYSQVFLLAALIDLMQNGITPARIAEIVGVSVDTVRGWQKRFRVFDDK